MIACLFLSDAMIMSYTMVITLILALTYTLLVIRYRTPIAATLGIIDYPKSQAHKAHSVATPLIGGISCLPPAIAAGMLSAISPGLRPEERETLIWMVSAGALSMFVGLVDDRKHIPAPIRLLICGSIFYFTMSAHRFFVIDAVTFESLQVRILIGGGAALAFSTLCLLAFQNAVNMADGRNGLVIGLSIIWSITLLAQGAHPTNLVMLVLLAGLVITMVYNIRGKLFLGDAGTYGLGGLIGLATIWVHQSGIGLTAAQVICMFLIPTLDMIRLALFRVAQRRSPFAADHHHLHHYLDRRFGWNRGRMVYFAIVIVPIVISELDDDIGNIGVVLGVLFYAVILSFSAKQKQRPTGAQAETVTGIVSHLP
jgi:UDP-GlcNAc:undecaprenyl-phosphate GlcNAc-1-phosphate transferase